MNELPIDKVIAKMNKYGSNQTPFLFIITYNANTGIVCPLADINPEELLYKCNELTNASEEKPVSPPTFSFSKQPVSYQQYLIGFNRIQEVLNTGKLTLINYTQATPIKTDLNLKAVFTHSNAKYKLWIKDKLVCFSPEIFVQIDNGTISTYPMKGTIDASLPNAEEAILTNKKELAEHTDCVNLLCTDLEKVATNVRVERFRYIDRVHSNQKDLLQVSSKICGDLPSNYTEHLGEIAAKLLPAGSITGQPKQLAVELIEQAEGYERGYYTGVFGIFDGKRLDSGVLIRFIEQTPDGLCYKSGGGITIQSKPEDEYQEMVDKVYVPIC